MGLASLLPPHGHQGRAKELMATVLRPDFRVFFPTYHRHLFPSAIVIGFNREGSWHSREINFDLLRLAVEFEQWRGRIKRVLPCSDGTDWKLRSKRLDPRTLFLQQLEHKRKGCWNHKDMVMIGRLLIEHDLPELQCFSDFGPYPPDHAGYAKPYEHTERMLALNVPGLWKDLPESRCLWKLRAETARR
jgi:hypothetical protein